MLLVRDVRHCKPGKVRPMVAKFDSAMKGCHDLVPGRREIFTIEE